jgi:hypothetical protein
VALNRPGKFMPADAYLNAAILVAVLPGLLAVLGWVLRGPSSGLSCSRGWRCSPA